MPREALTAVAAGLASAAAAMAFLSGSFATIGFVYLAPLPMLMAGLAFGPRAAAIAALSGVLALGFIGGTVLAGTFAAAQGLPTWAVVKLALMVHPHAPGAGARPGEAPAATGGSAQGAWMAPGWIVSALTVVAAAMILVAAGLVSDVGLSGYVADYLGQVLSIVAPGLDAANRGLFIQKFLPLFPTAVAAIWVLMVTVNAVIAQGLLVRLGHNRRPSPDYAGLDLPMWLSWPLVGAAVMALFGPGEWEYLGRNLVMVLALPYFLLGLAVFHTLARRVASTKALLVAFYLVIMISVWAAVVVAGIGVVEQWYGLRNRIKPAQTRGGQGDDDEEF
jgi:hypothetical protein